MTLGSKLDGVLTSACSWIVPVGRDGVDREAEDRDRRRNLYRCEGEGDGVSVRAR